MDEVENVRQTKRLVGMIRIPLKPEPASFPAVRQKGNKWLSSEGIPPDRHCEQKFWKGKDYWTEVWDDFCIAYDGICAYSCLPVGQGGTVDHYKEKAISPSLAYEWSNYRLTASRINSKKKGHESVFDPFLVPDEAFLLDSITGQIYPNPEKDIEIQTLATSTIRLLKLDSPSMRTERLKWINGYNNPDSNKRLPEDWVSKNAPFIHAELKRQGFL
jgi:hypothetical protein